MTPEAQQQSVAWMRESELKHGRLAMLAVAGWPMAELYSGDFLHGSGGFVLDAPLKGGESLYRQRLDHPLGVEVLGAERGAGELLGGVAGGGAVVGQHLQRATAVPPVGD